MTRRTAILITAGAAGLADARLSAAELKPGTTAAFERYVRATEARIDQEVRDEQRFLYIDVLAEPAGRTRGPCPRRVARSSAGSR